MTEAEHRRRAAQKAAEAFHALGIDPSPQLIAWATEQETSPGQDQGGGSGDGTGALLPTDPETGQPVEVSDDVVVEALRAAHDESTKHTAMLAVAREQRRMLAQLLRARGYSYRWIGDQIGVTYQAVEQMLKYRRRHPRDREA